MDSYIEVTFVHNMLLCIFAYYASAYTSKSKRSSTFFYPFLLIEQLLVVLCFNPKLSFVFYLFEVIGLLYIYYHNYKSLLAYLCIKYLAFFTCIKLIGGSFHLIHYFVPINSNIYGIWLVLLFIIVLLKRKWNAYLLVSEFIYPITIYANKTIRVKAFLDTGNQVCFNGIPVIFLDQCYQTYFTAMKKETMSISSINTQSEIDCYLCKVDVHRYKKTTYYICCDRRVALEWNCLCLLNIEI